LGRGASKPTGNSGNKHPGRGGGFGGRGGNGGGASGGMSSGARGRDKNAWVELIRALDKRELLPMVTFAFSRRRIDLMVDSLTGLDLTTTAEKHDIHVFCERCLSRLSPGDRKLPQVLRVRELLRRGLGVHHAGLLPIVKEIVEMLFCRGVIKALFSTETFAMGVNAPARSVCFQDLKKHDGVDFRGLTPGEYTQMAGRAGQTRPRFSGHGDHRGVGKFSHRGSDAFLAHGPRH
jgi:antiviral helicase SKI2